MTYGGIVGQEIESYDGYCNQQDLENRISARTLAELTNDNIGGGSIEAPPVDSGVVNSLILKANTFIDNALNGIYDVPFTTGSHSSETTPALIKQIAIDLSCYYAFQRREAENKMTDEWKRIYQDCIDILNRLACLDDTLNDATPYYKEASMTNASSTKVFSFTDSSNQVSWF